MWYGKVDEVIQSLTGSKEQWDVEKNEEDWEEIKVAAYGLQALKLLWSALEEKERFYKHENPFNKDRYEATKDALDMLRRAVLRLENL